MKERLKLKRGLSDISPLFTKREQFSKHVMIRKPEQAPVVRPVLASPEIVFSWSADDEGDAHFLNNYFASKLVSPLEPGLLLTVQSGKEEYSNQSNADLQSQSLKCLSISLEDLREAFCSSGFSEYGAGGGGRIFLEMKINDLMGCADLVRSLDRVVLFLHPQIESVTEAYRKLKKLVSKGLRAEVSIVFDADNAAGLPGYVYELFSDFISRNLSLNTNYLGILHLSRGGHGLSQDLKWSSWESCALSREFSLEKMRFLAWIQKFQELEVCR